MLHRRTRLSFALACLIALYASSALLYAAPETPRAHPDETGALFLPLVTAAPLVPPTLQSARLVKDIFPGTTSSNPYSLLARGSGIQFTASTPGQEQTNLRSNGTAQGTTLFTQLLANPPLEAMEYAGEVNDSLLFIASNSAAGLELWRTDHAFNNSELLARSTNATLRTLAFVKNNLFFFASEATGPKLWETDGTPAGTHRVSDANIVLGDRDPYLAVINNTVFFVVGATEGKRELWRSDGTSAGTLRIKTLDVDEGVDAVTYLKIQGETVLFALRELDSTGATTRHLWKTDGTEQGTVRVADVNLALGQYGLALVPSDGTYQYFLGYNADGKIALWRTDGTSAGTISLLPIGYDEQNHFQLQGVTFANNLNIFLLQDSSGSYQLWRTDGTTKGTFRLRDGVLTPTGSLAQTDKLAFFAAQSGTDGHDSSLWRSDGTVKGTFQVLTVKETNASFIDALRLVGESVFFRTGIQGEGTRGIGYSDGTKAGTHEVINVKPNDLFTSDTPTIANNTMYFAATDAAHGTELWKADGTNNTVQLVSDICPGSCSSTPDHITAVNDALVFAADDGTHGSEVWRSDGTKDGTTLVDDIQPGKMGSGPNWFTLADSHIFFSAAWSGVGNELWVMPTSAVSNVATATSKPPRVSGTYRIATHQ